MPAIRSERSDEEILARFLRNEPEAIALAAGWARAVARHRAWGFDSPEDIVQATLLTLVENVHAGRFECRDLRAYVRRIAKNICVSSYRRSRTRGVEVSYDETLGPDRMGRGPGLDPEQLWLLDRIIRKLDESCREIISLAYLEGYSRRQIADRLGISEGAAKVRLFRCLQRARKGLDLAGGAC